MAQKNDAPPIRGNESSFLQQQQRDAELVAAIQAQKEQQDRATVIQLMQLSAQKQQMEQQAAFQQAQQRPPFQPMKGDLTFPSYYMTQKLKAHAQPEGSLSAVQELWGKRGSVVRTKSAVDILFGDRFK